MQIFSALQFDNYGDSIIKTAGDFNLTDAQDTSSYSSKASTLTVEAGAKVGNAYVDAAYAWKAVVDAEKKAIQTVEKLNKMRKLKDDGRATDKAVELAVAQVVLANTAVATATIAAAAATAGAGSAAGSSLGTGMYGAGYLNVTASGVKNTTETSLSRASNFIGYGDIDIASGNNLTILGSLLASVNGNVTLSAANDIKIEAGTNTLSQSSKQETIYGGGSVGNNGVQLNIGLSQGESEYNKTFYTNSQISAENGTLTLHTGNDANISGANLLAKNIALNIGNNLNVESKQTEEDSSSSGFGFNFGGGFGAGSAGNGGNIGGGFNMSNSDMHRLWVDDITTIKGADSMTANVGKDLNLTGAAILSDNLALAVSGKINKKELSDSYYSESMGFGFSQNFTTNGNQATIPGTGGQPNQFPGGSTTISGSYAQNESSRTVYATIGGLNSTLTSSTKDVTGGDFEGSLTIDHRLFSDAGRQDIQNNLNQSIDLTVLGANKTVEVANKIAEQTRNLYNELGVLLTPQQKAEVDQALINGNTQKVYDLLKERGIEVSDITKEKIRQFAQNEIGGNKFLQTLTAEERQVLVQPKSIGVFFDGTNNNAYRDLEIGADTNVWKLKTLYVGQAEYLTGVGSSDEFGDTTCQAFGCGASNREKQAMDIFSRAYYNMISDGNNQPFVIADTIGFSRGSATARDFANLLLNNGVTSDNGSIMPQQIILRLVAPFDTVSSFGWPANEIDLGKNFSTNLDTYVIHPIAEDELRTNFPLQSIKPVPEASLPANWIEQSFPGVHSDIGGGYYPGEQGKSNEISLYTLNWMVSKVNQSAGEIIFNQPPSSQQPSEQFNDLMNFYLEAKQNHDQINMESAKTLLQNNYIHNSVIQYNPAHWSFGERNIYYPNNNLKTLPVFNQKNTQ